MPMTWNNNAILKVKKAKLTFLHAAGEMGRDQVIQKSHVLTGLYRNAVMYKVYDGSKSDFGSMPGLDGKVVKPEDEIGEPQKDFVRVGMNIVYANMLERMFGIVAGSIDLIQPRLLSLANKIVKQAL